MTALMTNRPQPPTPPLPPPRRPDEELLRGVKAAYTTRFVDRTRLVGLTSDRAPRPGDLVVAEVVTIGQHQRIERVDGRRARLYAGDRVLVAYGDRYAPDQFEATVPGDLGPCHLVAAGGVAAKVRHQHDTMKQATRILPIGLVVTDDGSVANLADTALAPAMGVAAAHGPSGGGDRPHRPHRLIVVGTSMNSGKTTTAAGLIRGLVRCGRRVGSAKITGTGAGGDLWSMADAGAEPVLDFTAAGHASTYRLEPAEVERIHDLLLGHLAAAGVDVAVVEIADGLFQRETAELLRSERIWRECDGVVFAAQDAIGARAGVAHLQELGVPVRAVSGLVTAAPLAVEEARAAIDVPILTLADLHAGDHALVPPPPRPPLSGSVAAPVRPVRGR